MRASRNKRDKMGEEKCVWRERMDGKGHLRIDSHLSIRPCAGRDRMGGRQRPLVSFARSGISGNQNAEIGPPTERHSYRSRWEGNPQHCSIASTTGTNLILSTLGYCVKEPRPERKEEIRLDQTLKIIKFG